MPTARHTDEVTIRRDTADDAPTLRQLAHLDSTRLPNGPFLIAEVGDTMLAAVSLTTGESFADPFSPTLELRALLELRASQLHDDEEERSSRASRTPTYRDWRTMGRRLALASSSRRTGVV
jgi:hypothetical protein